VEEIGEQCDCSGTGFENDAMGFMHTRNCDLPVGFLTVYFGIHTALVFLSIFGVLYVARELKSKILIIRQLFLIKLFTDWIHVLCVYLQGGMFVAGWVALVVNITVGFVWGNFMMVTFLEPVVAMDRRFAISKIKKRLLFFLAIETILLSGIVIAMIALGSFAAENLGTYNALSFAFLLVACSYLAVLLVTLFGTIQRFQRILEGSASANNSSHQETYASTQMRLKRIKWALRVLFVVYLCSLFPFFLIFAIFNYFPYFFLLWCGLMLATVFACPLVVFFLRKDQNKETNSAVRSIDLPSIT
jgi:hypothetical protein